MSTLGLLLKAVSKTTGKCRYTAGHQKDGEEMSIVLETREDAMLSGFLNAQTDDQGHNGYFMAVESDNIQWEIVETLQGVKGDKFRSPAMKLNREDPNAYQIPEGLSIKEISETMRAEVELRKEIRQIKLGGIRNGVSQEIIDRKVSEARAKIADRKAAMERILTGEIQYVLDIKTRVDGVVFEPRKFYPLVEKHIKPMGNNRVVAVKGNCIVAYIEDKLISRFVPHKIAKATQVGDYVRIDGNIFIFN